MQFFINRLIFIAIIFFSPLAFAATLSPYADITLNVKSDAKTQSMQPADLVNVAQTANLNSLHLAFITDAGVCKPAWGGQATYAVNQKWGQLLTNDLHNHKIDYTVSLGGASGNDLSLSCDAIHLLAAYENILTVYQPSGLDFDIENGTANVSRIMLVLAKLQANHPELKLSFTLPVMPEGLTWQGENVIKQAAIVGLRFSVNIMAMDYGPAYNSSMGDYAIHAAQNVFNFMQIYAQQKDADSICMWKRIQVTPMIGVNDVNSEKFTLQDADKLAAFAKQNNLGGLSYWSINRDLPCGDKFAQATCSGDNLQKVPYEFAAHMRN